MNGYIWVIRSDYYHPIRVSTGVLGIVVLGWKVFSSSCFLSIGRSTFVIFLSSICVTMIHVLRSEGTLVILAVVTFSLQ